MSSRPVPSVYNVRMARVNISIPDDLHDRARQAGLNVSRVAAGALESELRRRVKADTLSAYLAELDSELGPISPEAAATAARWAEQLDAGRSR